MDNYVINKLKNMLKLLKEGKTITVAEKIKRLALFLDYNGYGRTMEEIRKNTIVIDISGDIIEKGNKIYNKNWLDE